MGGRWSRPRPPAPPAKPVTFSSVASARFVPWDSTHWLETVHALPAQLHARHALPLLPARHVRLTLDLRTLSASYAPQGHILKVVQPHALTARLAATPATSPPAKAVRRTSTSASNHACTVRPEPSHLRVRPSAPPAHLAALAVPMPPLQIVSPANLAMDCKKAPAFSAQVISSLSEALRAA